MNETPILKPLIKKQEATAKPEAQKRLPSSVARLSTCLSTK